MNFEHPSVLLFCLNDEVPFKEPVRRVPIFKREIMDEEIRKLEDHRLIEKSNSPWSSPLVLVRKKDGSWRLCVDYRKLNSKTIKDAYPIPRVADDLDSLAGAKWFSSLDLNMAYHQIPMDEKDKQKTAFATPRGGLYQYRVMPFGLCNAPATFQRVIERALSGLQWQVTVLYLDDIIVYGRDFQEHLNNLGLVMDRLQAANQKLKAKKCRFFQKEVAFLGHIVTEHGVKTDPAKTAVVEKWRRPENVSELRSFLGLVSYYRRYIQNFAGIAKSLHALTSKHSEWKWTDECEIAFKSLKEKLISAPILGYPDANCGSFVLDTDASNESIGAVLSQIQNNEEVVIAYGSRTLSSSERNYCVTRKEMLAMVHFVKHFKQYLLGREFLLRTDHGALVWLHKFKEPEGQVARWLQQLAPYEFRIQHRAGNRHGNADALSRLKLCDVTCKQCKCDVSRDYDTKQYIHINDLRTNNVPLTTSDICDVFEKNCVFEKEICEIICDDTTESTQCSPVSVSKKQRVNRPPRAKARKQPTESLESANIRKHQLEDVSMCIIIKWLERGVKPPFSAISKENSECKFWYSRWDLLTMENGVMCIRWIENDKEYLKICVPRKLRDVILWQVHDSQCAGHMGIRRTYLKVEQSSYYWPHMRQFVQDYVSCCDICDERKNPTRRKRSKLKSYGSGEPFERIAMDITGPFPKSENGYVYILVVSDYFSKFTEVYPLQNMESETIANVLFKGWIKRYGCPGSIHSDQGRQFESHLFKGLCRLLQIDKTRTTPYHPQSDGLVERQNRTFKEMLSKYISVNQIDWDRYIDGLVLAYNCTPHESTDISPYRMVFGREARIPLDLMTENTSDSEYVSNEAEYVRKLQEELHNIHTLARDTMKKSMQRQKHYYDRNVIEVTYEVGDMVRRNQQKVAVGTKSKLARRWTGPWIITKRLSDVLYQIRHSKSSKAIIVHADSIKPYRGSKTPAQYTEPNTAANAPIPEDSERTSAFEDNVQMDSDNRSKTTDGEEERTRRGRVIRIPVRYRE